MEICLCAPACASARTRWGAKLTRCQCRERTPGRGQERSPRGFARCRWGVLPWCGLAQHRARCISPAWVCKTSTLQNEWEREKPVGASKQRNKRNRSMAVGSSASRPALPSLRSPSCGRYQDAPWRSRSWPRCPCRSSGTAWSRSGIGWGRAGGGGARDERGKNLGGNWSRAGAGARTGQDQGQGQRQGKGREGPGQR